MRDSAVIYKSLWEKFEVLRDGGQEDLAKDILVAAVYRALTGEDYTDNVVVKAMLTELSFMFDVNEMRYQNKAGVDAQEQQLEQIADLYNQGYTQKEIAEKVGNITQQGVSRRIKKIKEQYPELLQQVQQAGCTTGVQQNGYITNTTNTTNTTGVQQIQQTGCTTNTTNFTTNTTNTTNQLYNSTTKNTTNTTNTTNFCCKNHDSELVQQIQQIQRNVNVNVNGNVNGKSCESKDSANDAHLSPEPFDVVGYTVGPDGKYRF